MTGMLMGKSKHIKGGGQMILFFFNDSACSETDGERKAGTQRLDERMQHVEKAAFGLIMMNSERCLPKDGQVSLAVDEGFVLLS